MPNSDAHFAFGTLRTRQRVTQCEFAVQQTRYWAEKGKAAEWTDEERIRSLYREAFAREPTDVELQTASEFLREEGQRDRPPEEIWGDLCHVLINVKEFVFIR